MGRLLRGVLVLAGVVAVLWAVRERFVTVGRPVAQAPMSFRVSPQAPTPPPHALTSIRGIGPVYAERLASAGITDAGALVDAGPLAVAKAAEVSIARATSWVTTAADD
jgi:predicted flap endonuclease-1-like 5' DNA nuclease